MRYAISRYTASQREETYRIFVSESWKMITENTAMFAGGKTITVSYADLIKPPKPQEKPEDIIERIKKGAKAE